ncbi:hypothetical protein [Pseudonocardia sp.]|jgi:hypothetical protein|uniref:hypothetical protein n=1 Tax=Pseudonocardia sp. TaxID=60912 RepID=UPI00261411C5|nr:hypothetical protein [Pseudonocardia sp.]MCW2717965.1 hypothetical protein [Pseudonocardia sp.]
MAELPSERPEDDDHDLLTFGEAGVRLREELVVERGRLAELEEQRSAGEAVDDAIEALTARIAGLEDAGRRNVASSQNFFSYRPVAPE